MPEVWYQDESCKDYRDYCHFDPPRYLTLEELKASTGVEIYEIGVDNVESNVEYQRIKKEHGYKYEDILEISEEKMKKEEIEVKLKMFYKEHLHDDEEVRMFLEGGGFFDVRDTKDNWIRIHVSKGDLLNIPAGIYHRFNIGKEKYVKIRRLYSETPVWEAKFRPEADSAPSRQEYLKNILLKQTV